MGAIRLSSLKAGYLSRVKGGGGGGCRVVVSVFTIADRAAHGFRWKTVILLGPGQAYGGEKE